MIGNERANPETLNGLFSSFDGANWTDKNKLSDERLRDLLSYINRRIGETKDASKRTL